MTAIDSMVIEYMRHRGFEFSLSVYVPECGVGSIQKVLDRNDVIQALKLDKFTFSDKNDNPLLLVILDALIELRSKSDKIPNISTGILGRTKESLLEYQQELERNSAKQLEEQLNSFKEIEISRVRLEERKKYTAELDNQKQYYEKRLLELETFHQQVLEDERQRINEKESELEKHNIELKQRIINESNQALLAERKARADIELQAKELEFERDQLSRKYASLQSQSDEINEFKERYILKMEEAIARSKMDLNKEYATMMAGVESEKAQLESIEI